MRKIEIKRKERRKRHLKRKCRYNCKPTIEINTDGLTKYEKEQLFKSIREGIEMNEKFLILLKKSNHL